MTEPEVILRTKHYEIVQTMLNSGAPWLGIRCRKCRMTSYNMGDVTERYCGSCHVFHEDREEEQVAKLWVPGADAPQEPSKLRGMWQRAKSGLHLIPGGKA